MRKHRRDYRPDILSWSGRPPVVSPLDDRSRQLVAKAISQEVRHIEHARFGAVIYRDAMLGKVDPAVPGPMTLDLFEIERRIELYSDRVDTLRGLGDRLGLTVGDFMLGDSRYEQVDKGDPSAHETTETTEE